MDKFELVDVLNELNHKLRRTIDRVEREKIQLGINALENTLIKKIRVQNEALVGSGKG